MSSKTVWIWFKSNKQLKSSQMKQLIYNRTDGRTKQNKKSVATSLDLILSWAETKTSMTWSSVDKKSGPKELFGSTSCRIERWTLAHSCGLHLCFIKNDELVFLSNCNTDKLMKGFRILEDVDWNSKPVRQEHRLMSCLKTSLTDDRRSWSYWWGCQGREEEVRNVAWVPWTESVPRLVGDKEWRSDTWSLSGPGCERGRCERCARLRSLQQNVHVGQNIHASVVFLCWVTIR